MSIQTTVNDNSNGNATKVQSKSVKSPEDDRPLLTSVDLSSPDYGSVHSLNEGTSPASNPRNMRLMSTKFLKCVLVLLIFVLYNVYLGFAIHHDWKKHSDWCKGSRILLVITILTYIMLTYYLIIKPFTIRSGLLDRLASGFENVRCIWQRYSFLKWLLYGLLLSGVIIFYLVDAWQKWYRFIPLGGMATIIFLGFIFSNNKKKIAWSQLAWGLGIQFCMGVLILRWTAGRQFFQCLSDKVVTFLSYADDGTAFVFDYLGTGNMTSVTFHYANSTRTVTGDIILQSVFAFKVLPVILYFSFFISILYYYGIMQRVIIKLGWLLYISIGTTAAESMNAAASVFVGMTEAPLMIRPYMALMTKSELHTVMAGGFATIAGTVFAAYISFGINGLYLLSGALMSAPTALAFSKLLYPETEKTNTSFESIKIEKGEERNVLEAAANGAIAAISLVAGIATGLIVFIAFIQFLDALIMWGGGLVGCDDISLEWILGKAFMPMAFLMGIKWEECDQVGILLGIKTVVNEFVAYKRLTQIEDTLSHRSVAITTFALCSFSNLSSLGVQIGVLGTMVPSRKADIAEVGFRALCAGAASCFLTACLAGSLLDY